MSAVATASLTGAALDWAVAKIEGGWILSLPSFVPNHRLGRMNFSTDWAQAGPILERKGITTIRADDDYEVDEQGFTTDKRIPQWFAQCGRCTGHSTTTSYEGEHMDPTFMIEESSGHYGPTPLVAAMRAYVVATLGDTIEVPEELLT